MGLSVEDVIAHAVYDPVARRERYLKKRQLKGRQRATPAPPKGGVGSRVVDANLPVSARTHAMTARTKTEVAAASSSARQVAEIKGKLNKLKAHLQELLAQKKKESTGSAESKSSTSSSSKKESSKPAKPQTAKQKQAAEKALKEAQKERAKQQKATPDKPVEKTPATLDEQITRARAVITDVEAKLRAAIESARTQTASNGR